MGICIGNVIDAAELHALQEALAARALYENGASTAGAGAAAVKANLQGRPASSLVRGACEKVRRSLLANETLCAAALPVAFARVMINRYETGMGYGWHSDESFIDGVRTDLSFTLFLSDPASYDGGALEIASSGGTDVFKLDAGSALVYSSGDLHRVENVTRGVRLAAVGWIQSRIRSTEQRELQFNLASTLAKLAPSQAEAASELAATRHKLLRMWSDSTHK